MHGPTRHDSIKSHVHPAVVHEPVRVHAGEANLRGAETMKETETERGRRNGKTIENETDFATSCYSF